MAKLMWKAELVEGEWCLVDLLNRETFRGDTRETAEEEAARQNLIYQEG